MKFTCSPNTVLQERYEILDIVNTSPASKLYKGYDAKENCHVLIKEMISDFIEPSLKQEIIEQFKCEAKILFRLKHDYLPKFKDYFDHNSNRYLVLDYIKCKRLITIIETNSGFLPEKKVIDWAVQLCDVLSYLHNSKPNPIIFRDLSPHSIFLTDDGKIKLLDFGISKIVNSDTMNMAKVIIPHYSPLEQHTGTTDNRSDIYSLGATMYYLLTKEPPMDSLDRIIEDEPMPTCNRFNKDISPTLVKIISKAMEPDKKDRYQTIEELQSELLKLFSEENIKKQKKSVTTSPLNSNEEKPYNLKRLADINQKILPNSPIRPGKVFMSSQKMKEIISKKHSDSYPDISNPLTVFSKIPPTFINENHDKQKKSQITENIVPTLQIEEAIMLSMDGKNIPYSKPINQQGDKIIKFTGIEENIKEEKEIEKPTIFASLFAWLRTKLLKEIIVFNKK
jgi:serine/threonine protein kinase